MDQDLIDEIKWVMTHFGSDAGERQQPGSKLQSQAERIAEFVDQRNEAQAWLNQHGYNWVRITRSYKGA